MVRVYSSWNVSLDSRIEIRGEWMSPWGVMKAQKIGIFTSFFSPRAHTNFFIIRICSPNLCKQARERPEARRLNDIDELLSIRLSGTERVWGIFRKGVLQLLWWDPKQTGFCISAAEDLKPESPASKLRLPLPNHPRPFHAQADLMASSFPEPGPLIG
jgi:hypothetical protein